MLRIICSLSIPPHSDPENHSYLIPSKAIHFYLIKASFCARMHAQNSINYNAREEPKWWSVNNFKVKTHTTGMPTNQINQCK